VKKKTKINQKRFPFMPRRNRDNSGKFLPNTPTTSHSHPSLFFGGSDQEEPLGEQPEIFEEPIGEEEEENIPPETMAENRNARGNGERVEGTFPIRETNGDTKMKNISPSALPHFHGLTTEDPDTFLFEFVVICRTYDYAEDEKKLKLFPSTLKDAALRWFMGLPGNSITTWAQMQQAFNNKYRDYCRSKDTKEEIFRMTMGSDESLEDYEERFQLSYKRARCTLDPESLKLVLLRGIPEDLLDTLHLLAGGDIYQLPYEDIKTVFRNHSRAARKRGRGSQPIASTSSSSSSLKGELGNMLEDFKSEMLQTLAMQMDTLHIKRKQEEAERALAIFCPRCTRRHPRNECPLNSIEVCSVCEEDHSTISALPCPDLKLYTKGPKEPLNHSIS
jgi:hypothetical protein